MTSIALHVLLVLYLVIKIHETNGNVENNCPAGCQCNRVLMTETNESFFTYRTQRDNVAHTIAKRGSKNNNNTSVNGIQELPSDNMVVDITKRRKRNKRSDEKILEKNFETSFKIQHSTDQLRLAVTCHNLEQVPFVVDGTKIITLQLANTSFPSLHVNFTSKFPNLEWLFMSNTGLRAILPGSLQAMPKLIELWISNCHHALILEQDTFTGSDYIMKITIQHCKLQTVDKNMFVTLKSLHHLDMSFNNLTSTSDATLLSRHSNSTIGLSGNQPVPKSWSLQLPDNIQELILSHNNIINLEKISSETLVSLDICFNSFPKVRPEQISLPRLVSLCLGGPQLELTTGLLTEEKFPQLSRLAIKGTEQKQLQVKDKAARDLQKMIKKKLYTLELENCRINEPQLVMRMPGSALQYLRVINTTIRAMRLTRNTFNISAIAMLDFSGTPYLAQAFLNPPPYVQVNRSFSHLTTLVLANTNTKKIHGNLFSQLPQLAELDISQNPLECTCRNFGWLLGYVALNRLTLLNPNETECAFPEHMKGKLILTANFCSYTADGTNITAVSTNKNSAKEENTENSEGRSTSGIKDVSMSSSETITASGQAVAASWATVILLVTVITTIKSRKNP